ncbi:MAG: type II secretion system F family protein [Eubacterium sp.]|nr:type II secretion system F family protein [Eubacterium sp.]
MRDYSTYNLNKKELIMYGLIGYAGGFMITYLFFGSKLFSVVSAVPCVFFFIKYIRNSKAKKQRQTLVSEFKDACDSFVSALSAGYSMDNCVTEAEKDLKLLYKKETIMTEELAAIREKLKLGQPLDELLYDLGARSGVEDIIVFSQVYATARKSGGNLVKIMKRTSDAIGEKIDIEREVTTMVSGKKMESMCMMIIPLMIIVYLNIFSPGFLTPLYRGIAGRVFMGFALAVYIATVLWSKKIMNISV